MFAIIGIVCVFALVFGGYMMAGGKFDVILHSAPHELVTICGAALGAFIIGNGLETIKATGGGFAKVFSGPKWNKKDFQQLLTLLFQLTKVMKTKGVVALEQHIDNPKESTIFSNYPKILKDHFAVDFICDTLRMMTMNLEDPHQVEDVMEKQLEKHHHEALGPVHAIQSIADAMPALGIVAAVLGVIKTMSKITAPPEELGASIGGALVGTFLGVFIAYGFIGPFAQRLSQIVEEEGHFYRIIQAVLIAHLHGCAAQVSIEIGRTAVPGHFQPSFAQLEEALNAPA